MQYGQRVVAQAKMAACWRVASGNGLFRKTARPPETGPGGRVWEGAASVFAPLLAGLAGAAVAHRLYGTGGALCLRRFLGGPAVAGGVIDRALVEGAQVVGGF